MNKRNRLIASGLGVLVIFFLVAQAMNTNTLFGRWLMWREPSYEAYLKLPAAPVANDPARAFTFPVAEPPPALTSFTYVSKPFTSFLEENDTHAFIIVRAGSVVYEGYFNGAQRESLNLAYSISKSYISALVGIAIEQGHISSVKDPVTKYLPELTGAGFEKVTLEHLLTMSSGVQWSTEKIFGVPAWWSDFYQADFSPDIKRLLFSLKLTQPPQERFVYNNYNPALLGLILERTTGQSVPTYAQSQLWQPLGAEYPASWMVDSPQTNFAKMSSGLYARAIDYAKFGQLFLQCGQWNGAQLIPAAWVEQSTTPQGNDLLVQRLSRLENLTAETRAAILSMRYYYLWWGAERDDHSAFYANGNRGQFIYVVPEYQFVIVRTGASWGEGQGDEHWLQFFYTLVNHLTQP